MNICYDGGTHFGSGCDMQELRAKKWLKFQFLGHNVLRYTLELLAATVWNVARIDTNIFSYHTWRSKEWFWSYGLKCKIIELALCQNWLTETLRLFLSALLSLMYFHCAKVQSISLGSLGAYDDQKACGKTQIINKDSTELTKTIKDSDKIGIF